MILTAWASRASVWVTTSPVVSLWPLRYKRPPLAEGFLANLSTGAGGSRCLSVASGHPPLWRFQMNDEGPRWLSQRQDPRSPRRAPSSPRRCPCARSAGRCSGPGARSHALSRRASSWVEKPHCPNLSPRTRACLAGTWA